VRTVLHDPGFRSSARLTTKDVAQYEPFEAIAEICATGR